MIIISANQNYIHTDSDGNKFEFRYITGRNQAEYNKAVSAYSEGLKKLEKIEKEGAEKVSESDIAEVGNILDECNKSLAKLLLCGVNEKQFKDGYEEFVIDLPVNSQKEFYDIMYKLLPILSGAEKGELKN